MVEFFQSPIKRRNRLYILEIQPVKLVKLVEPVGFRQYYRDSQITQGTAIVDQSANGLRNPDSTAVAEIYEYPGYMNIRDIWISEIYGYPRYMNIRDI